jgi:cell wall-associated NlpC family hydrolase
MSYWLNGVSIYRDASIQPGFPVKEISQEELQPGDTLYFPGHIALYLGEGNYVHSTGSQGGVVLNSLDPTSPKYYKKHHDELYARGSIF